MSKIWIGAAALGCALAASATYMYWQAEPAPADAAGTAAGAAQAATAGFRAVPAAAPKASAAAAAAEFSFLPPALYPIASARPDDRMYPLAVAVGDVTGDGRDDLVVTSKSARNEPEYLQPNVDKVMVYAQRADGTLPAAPILLDYRPPNGPGGAARGLQLADMNSDGVLDIAIVFPAGAAIFINDGAGGFRGPSPYFLMDATTAEGSIAVLDYNQDGRLDILAIGFGGSVRAFLGNGNGGFLPTAPLSLDGTTIGNGIASVADVTGDGLPDLVYATDYNAALLVRAQLPGGGLAPLRAYPAPDNGKRAFGMTVGDFDQDGRNDVAFAGTLEYDGKVGTLAIYRQNGEGRFDPPAALAWRNTRMMEMLLAADLDRDGKTDLVGLEYGPGGGPDAFGGIGVFLQGDHGFLPPRLFSRAVGSADEISIPHGVAAGDLNGDGCTDVAYASSSGTVVNYGQNCTPRRLPVPPRDLDGDGGSDMAWLHELGYLATWTLHDGQRLAGRSFTVGAGWRVLAIDDFDGDGRAELVWSDGNGMQMWRSDGAGGYLGTAMQAYPRGYRVVAHGDFDGDGKADLAWRDAADTQVSLWYMDGARTLRGHATALAPGGRVAGSGDLNGDGRTDLLIENQATLRLWSGRAVGGFADAAIGAYPSGWVLAGTGDANGDGRAEVFWRLPGSEHLARWFMDGSRRTTGIGYRQDAAWRVLDVADYTGDGRADLVWTDGTGMRMWAAQGPGFADKPMPGYPAGWTLQR
ncbi:FG-GAP repeat domain-containing protein [Lysobacter enzymogenes]|uniref:Repeat domain-containing protein n=1 Tax=Lysobacter enzymogenes TaxID=69 RepID=A0AAU9AGK3_LYSEN|nr:VCBS repeat-containing protein [Lysobacter enzymogenes]BAV97048.1 hypothetical protein LEN_1561 [Lysobacter enzymogenes]